MVVTLELLASFDGVAIPLSWAPDPILSELMMGDGLVLEPLSDTLRALFLEGLFMLCVPSMP
jgi:phosphotransferase system IIA component